MLSIIKFAGRVWREVFPEKTYRVYLGSSVVYSGKSRLSALKQFDRHVQGARRWKEAASITLILKVRGYNTKTEVLKLIKTKSGRENDTHIYNIPFTSGSEANGGRRVY